MLEKLVKSNSKERNDLPLPIIVPTMRETPVIGPSCLCTTTLSVSAGLFGNSLWLDLSHFNSEIIARSKKIIQLYFADKFMQYI